jgi:hypothetical protein
VTRPSLWFCHPACPVQHPPHAHTNLHLQMPSARCAQAVQPLVEMLKLDRGTPNEREVAAFALRNLAAEAECRDLILEAGAVPLLVALVDKDDPSERAATTCMHVLSMTEKIEKAIDAAWDALYPPERAPEVAPEKSKRDVAIERRKMRRAQAQQNLMEGTAAAPPAATSPPPGRPKLMSLASKTSSTRSSIASLSKVFPTSKRAASTATASAQEGAGVGIVADP